MCLTVIFLYVSESCLQAHSLTVQEVEFLSRKSTKQQALCCGVSERTGGT